MEDNVLSFDNASTKEVKRSKRQNIPIATSNPYDARTSPADILQFLPPDGTMFGLYSDPYARMAYYMPKNGNGSARYWLESRLQEHSFTENELKLISFLSEHRCASKAQITKAIFTEKDNAYKIRDFLQKCHNRGIISAFSWLSPCDNGRKKPLIYGLTHIGAEAAEYLFQKKLPKDFKFQAVQFPPGLGPSMKTFYHYLVANELYCHLVAADRIVKWEKEPRIHLSDQSYFKPHFVAEVIKDAGELKTLWIEVVRIEEGWYENTIKRFIYMQNALLKLPKELLPSRIFMIADCDSRIPILNALAEEYVPDGVIRFTTDERLAGDWNEQTFVLCGPDGELLGSPIPFLFKDSPGMTASEYLAQQTIQFDDEFEDF
ncbi:replication-relaxation family protein [Rummeliibacillus stabekisii]|uniref:replication-relaxation family protein n=1 Tax=Rummeliibacillus stabekisii TaxID=241244 RepID=UPI003718DB33